MYIHAHLTNLKSLQYMGMAFAKITYITTNDLLALCSAKLWDKWLGAINSLDVP